MFYYQQQKQWCLFSYFCPSQLETASYYIQREFKKSLTYVSFFNSFFILLGMFFRKCSVRKHCTNIQGQGCSCWFVFWMSWSLPQPTGTPFPSTFQKTEHGNETPIPQNSCAGRTELEYSSDLLWDGEVGGRGRNSFCGVSLFLRSLCLMELACAFVLKPDEQPATFSGCSCLSFDLQLLITSNQGLFSTISMLQIQSVGQFNLLPSSSAYWLVGQW